MKLLWCVVTLPARCHFRLHNRCDGDISHPGDHNLCSVAVLSCKCSGELLFGWTRFFLLLLDEKERPVRCKTGTYHRYRPILQCNLAAVLLFLLPKRMNKVITVNSIPGSRLKIVIFFWNLHNIFCLQRTINSYMGFLMWTKLYYLSVVSVKLMLPGHVVWSWFVRQISYIHDSFYLELFYDFGIKFGYNVAAFSQRSLATTTLARLFLAEK